MLDYITIKLMYIAYQLADQMKTKHHNRTRNTSDIYIWS